MLFVSGIVGHRTLHKGDAAAQTRESMASIAFAAGVGIARILGESTSRVEALE
jgi:hypothetical protein